MADPTSAARLDHVRMFNLDILKLSIFRLRNYIVPCLPWANNLNLPFTCGQSYQRMFVFSSQVQQSEPIGQSLIRQKISLLRHSGTSGKKSPYYIIVAQVAKNLLITS